MKEMYKGIAFSPVTVLAQAVGEADTIIRVGDSSVFPAAPNYATIDDCETILYSQIAEGLLSGCTRGVEGAAVAHTAGSKIARLFTSEDYNKLVENVSDIVIPTKVSELENDSEFAPVASVPTKVSQLVNDSEFATNTAITAYTATATYADGFYCLDIANLPPSLPDQYTLTFTAPESLTMGDKIRVNGVEHLMNLYGNLYSSNSNFYNDTGDTTLFEFNGFFKSYTDSDDQYTVYNSNEQSISTIKANTDYTSICEIIDIDEDFLYWSTQSKGNDWCYSGARGLTKGYNKFKVLSKSEIPTVGKLIRPTFNAPTLGQIGVVTARQMLLEGDYTTKDLPAPYWENTYGEYDILATGLDHISAPTNSFLKGQTVTLNVGISGAYLLGSFGATASPLSIPTTLFTADKAYTDYPFRAKIPHVGLTASDSVNVNFDVASVTLANTSGIASVTVSAANEFYLYAKTKPTAALNGSISIVKGGA